MRGATMREEQSGSPIDELEEVEGNFLAEKTLEIVDRLRPHSNAILLGVAGLILAVAAWILVSSQSAATKSQSWDAYLAGLAVGFWKNPAEIAAQWQADRRFVPTMKPAPRQKLLAGWNKALTRAKRWEEIA